MISTSVQYIAAEQLDPSDVLLQQLCGHTKAIAHNTQPASKWHQSSRLHASFPSHLPILAQTSLRSSRLLQASRISGGLSLPLLSRDLHVSCRAEASQSPGCISSLYFRIMHVAVSGQREWMKGPISKNICMDKVCDLLYRERVLLEAFGDC